MTESHSHVPVVGHICPACAEVDQIIDESETEPLGGGDLVGAWLFGLLGVLLALSGRTTRRLRCLRCRCRFGYPPGLPAKLIVWLVVTGVAGVLLSVAARVYAPKDNNAFLRWVSATCTTLAKQPMLAASIAATLALSGVLAVVIGHVRESYRRHEICRAIQRRRGIPGMPPPGEAAATVT